jgi:signal peptidase I
VKKTLKILSLAVLSLVVFAAVMRFAGYRSMRYPAGVRNSMRPTISPGDIWLCRIRRGYAPEDIKRGMVILFSRDDFDLLLTKRVIALGDQTVEIRGRTTFVDGEMVAEPYAVFSDEDPSGGNRPRGASILEPAKVPPGKLFVMGDNRDDSLDSRDRRFGFVDVKDIVGRPVLLLWARDRSRIGRRMK